MNIFNMYAQFVLCVRCRLPILDFDHFTVVEKLQKIRKWKAHLLEAVWWTVAAHHYWYLSSGLPVWSVLLLSLTQMHTGWFTHHRAKWVDCVFLYSYTFSFLHFHPTGMYFKFRCNNKITENLCFMSCEV